MLEDNTADVSVLRQGAQEKIFAQEAFSW